MDPITKTLQEQTIGHPKAYSSEDTSNPGLQASEDGSATATAQDGRTVSEISQPSPNPSEGPVRSDTEHKTHIHSVLDHCRCNECRYCLFKPGHCTCKCCKSCGWKVPDCVCSAPWVPRHTTKRGWKPFAVFPVQEYKYEGYEHKRLIGIRESRHAVSIISGNYTHIVAFRSPFAIATDLFRRLRRTELVEDLWYRISTFHSDLRGWFHQSLESEIESTHINVRTTDALQLMVTRLAALPREEPNITFDMECHRLGPYARPCLLSIRDESVGQDYLVDLKILNQKAWTTKNVNGLTLKDIFEDPSMPKMIWAVAQDALSLHANHRIGLRGIVDLQYMMMLRGLPDSGNKPNLAQGVQREAALSDAELEIFLKNQTRIGEWYKFRQRPLAEEEETYALNDLRYLKRMYTNMRQHLSDEEMEAVLHFSRVEVDNACAWPKGWIQQRSQLRPEFRKQFQLFKHPTLKETEDREAKANTIGNSAGSRDQKDDTEVVVNYEDSNEWALEASMWI